MNKIYITIPVVLILLAIAVTYVVVPSADAALHPRIKVVNPQEGDTISGKLTIQVQITNVCLEAYHYGAGVQLFIDDKKFKGKGKFVSSEGAWRNCVELYKWDWGTGNKDNGEHTMYAKGCHSGGWVCYTSDPVTIIVANTKGNF